MKIRQLWAVFSAWARKAFTLGEDYEAFEGWDESCWNAWDDWEQRFRGYYSTTE